MKTFRRKIAGRRFSVSASGLRHQWAQGKASAAAELGHLDFGNRSRRLQVADPPVRRAANEKGRRALMASRLRRNSASSCSSDNSCNSASKVARLAQPIAARHKDSRKAGKIDNQKKRHRHRHVRNNFGAITSGSGTRNSGAAFFIVACAVLSALGIVPTNSAEDSGRYNSSAICTAFKAAPLSS